MGDHQVSSPPGERRASVGSTSGLVQLLRTNPSPARSFGRTRANTRHTQSAPERESVGGSDRGSRMYSREEHERLATGDVEQWTAARSCCGSVVQPRICGRRSGTRSHSSTRFLVSMFSEHCAAEAAELIGNPSLRDECTLDSHCSLFRSILKGNSSQPNFCTRMDCEDSSTSTR